MKRDLRYNSLFIGQLKELLHDFNLPRFPVVTNTTKPFEDRVYIKDDKVVKYLNGEYVYLYDYAYNKPIINLTDNFTINSSYYDQYTHKYLGRYLRFMRDYHHIDLMGLYNCFNNEQPTLINHMSTWQEDGVVNSFIINVDKRSDENDLNKYSYFIVPVKFNEKYTIAIDSSVDYEIACILYNNKFISSTTEDLIKESHKKINGSKFTKPFIYSTEFECAKDLWKKEKDLVLLLKLPKTINSSIVILEGDYVESTNVIDGTLVTKFIYSDKNDNLENVYPDKYYSKLSLLEFNNRVSYPFSDRLMEYILGNVITRIDPISENIEKVQEKIYPNGLSGFYGIWDESIRKVIYEKAITKDMTKGFNGTRGKYIRGYDESAEDVKPKKFVDLYNDLTFNIDKDIESLIGLTNSITVVQFDKNGGTRGTDSTKAIKGKMLFDVRRPYRAGYTFLGYFANGKMYYNEFGIGVRSWDNDDPYATLKAEWRKNV